MNSFRGSQKTKNNSHEPISNFEIKMGDSSDLKTIW